MRITITQTDEDMKELPVPIKANGTMTDEKPTSSTVFELMIQRKKACTKHALAFRQTFGRPLREFWEGNLIGFDVLKFDAEVVKPPDGTSTQKAIIEQFGQDAWQMISDLL